MAEIDLPYQNLVAVLRRTMARVYVVPNPTNGWTDVVTQDGGIVLKSRVMAGTDDDTHLQTYITPLANGPMPIKVGRTRTHDFADPSTWTGDSLPDGHPDKPGATFVTRDAGGKATAWTYVNDQPGTCPNGYIKRLDNTAFNAADATTFWPVKSRFRLTPQDATSQGVILHAVIETNLHAYITTSIDFQLWTYVDPANGFAPCAPSTAGALLVAPAAGLWHYVKTDEMRALADHKDVDPVELPGETGYGPRMNIGFTYLTQLTDDQAREAVMDGRFGQFIDITLGSDTPVHALNVAAADQGNAKAAVAHFKILTVPAF